MADFNWNQFGYSPTKVVEIFATALQSSASKVLDAFSTLSQDASNTGYQFMYQYYSNINNITLQNASQAVANVYEVAKKILENTRS